MKTALDFAVSQLGVKEATGQNDGLPAERYMHGEKGYEWCAAFVVWCFDQAKTRLPGNQRKDWSCRELHAQLSLSGAILAESLGEGGPGYVQDEPRRGDLVFFARQSGSGWHMGIIEDLDEHMIIHTIEGNRRNAVARAQYDFDDPSIRCFARWPVETPALSVRMGAAGSGRSPLRS